MDYRNKQTRRRDLNLNSGETDICVFTSFSKGASLYLKDNMTTEVGEVPEGYPGPQIERKSRSVDVGPKWSHRRRA